MLKATMLLVFIPVLVNAQNIKKVVQKNNKSNCKEIFYVLKTDEKIRQGSYQKICDGTLSVSGFYSNNLMDSTWADFGWNGKITSKGNYKSGVKTGVWEYYSSEGKLIQKYDCDKKTLIYNQAADKQSPNLNFKILNVNTTAVDSVNGPVYIGGEERVLKSLVYNVQYPQSSRDNDVQGKVLTSFVIDTNGQASQYKIIESVAKDIDAEALRVIKLLPNDWVPARVNGRLVEAEIIFPLVFKLQ